MTDRPSDKLHLSIDRCDDISCRYNVEGECTKAWTAITIDGESILCWSVEKDE